MQKFYVAGVVEHASWIRHHFMVKFSSRSLQQQRFSDHLHQSVERFSASGVRDAHIGQDSAWKTVAKMLHDYYNCFTITTMVILRSKLCCNFLSQVCGTRVSDRTSKQKLLQNFGTSTKSVIRCSNTCHQISIQVCGTRVSNKTS